jgi:hypothetical protein
MNNAVVAYIRYDIGESTLEQCNHIIEYCKKNNFNIVNMVIENASPLFQGVLPKLEQLIATSNNMQLIISDITRLTLAPWYAIYLLHMMDTTNVRLYIAGNGMVYPTHNSRVSLLLEIVRIFSLKFSAMLETPNFYTTIFKCRTVMFKQTPVPLDVRNPPVIYPQTITTNATPQFSLFGSYTSI